MSNIGSNYKKFKLGDIEITRLGFGTMRILGPGFWGEPEDRDEAIRVLKKARELDIDFIDTADSYGPFVSENLIYEALYPYKNIVIATKGGLVRHGPSYELWPIVGRPEYLRQTVLMSLQRLHLEQISLWFLHRIDPKVPRDEQFDVISQMQKEGLIKYVGLSEVNIEEIEAAKNYFEVIAVQNHYNFIHREHEEILNYCEKNNIGFIPFFPLSAGDLLKEGSILDQIAKKKNASHNQIIIAWLLKRSKVMIPIPGTSKVKHLVENYEALNIELTDEEFSQLDAATK